MVDGQSHDVPSAAQSPRIIVSRGEDRPTLHVIGRVDRILVMAVSTAIHELLAVDVRELVVDLSGVVNGAALLPVLAHTRSALLGRGGFLRLLGVKSPDFLGALATAPREQVFLVYDAVSKET